MAAPPTTVLTGLLDDCKGELVFLLWRIRLFRIEKLQPFSESIGGIALAATIGLPRFILMYVRFGSPIPRFLLSHQLSGSGFQFSTVHSRLLGIRRFVYQPST